MGVGIWNEKTEVWIIIDRVTDFLMYAYLHNLVNSYGTKKKMY